MNYSSQYNSSNENKKIIQILLQLVISIIIIISSFILLLVNSRNLDKNINRCISKNIQLVYYTNNLILETGSAQRKLLSLAIVNNQKKRSEIIQQWQFNISKSEKFNNKLIQHFKSDQIAFKNFSVLKKCLNEREKYIKSSKESIQLLEGNKSEISHLLLNELNPEFKKYRGTQLEVQKLLNIQFMEESLAITNNASNNVWIVFLVGVSPFFFLGYKLFKGTFK